MLATSVLKVSLQCTLHTLGIMVDKPDLHFFQVVLESLTYVNTHAGLVASITADAVTKVVPSVQHHGLGVDAACNKAVELITEWCRRTLNASRSSTSSDARLDSFVIYLLQNDCSERLIRMAILEQICLPGLENRGTEAVAVIKAAEVQLAQMKKSRPDETRELKSWHQAYHTFRLSAHSFVKGAGLLAAQKYNEALEYLTSAYILNTRIIDGPPVVSLQRIQLLIALFYYILFFTHLQGIMKCLKVQTIVRLLCNALGEANGCIIKQLKLGEHLSNLRQSVVELIAPAMAHLEARVKRGDGRNDLSPADLALLNQTKNALESARQEWCNLLGDDQLNRVPELQLAVSDMLSIVLEPPPVASFSQRQQEEAYLALVASKLTTGGDRMTQLDDFELSKSYADTMERLDSEEGGVGEAGGSRIS